MRLMACSNDLRFQCYLLEEADVEELFDICNGHDLKKEAADTLRSLASSLKTSAENEKERFVLWDAKEEIVLGHARILKHPNSRVFTGAEVNEARQGEHLIDYLHAARFQLLQEQGYLGEIVLNTGRDNTRCMKAAIRNGFQIDPRERNNFRLVCQAESLRRNLNLESARRRLFEDPGAKPLDATPAL